MRDNEGTEEAGSTTQDKLIPLHATDFGESRFGHRQILSIYTKLHSGLA